MVEQQSVLDFLVSNMEEMEAELRAHSIVLEALELHLITPDEIPGSLTLARKSHAMLEYVERKYARFPHEPQEMCDTSIESLVRLSRASGITH